MTKKIIQVCREFTKEGGIGRSVYELTNYLSSRYDDVTTLSEKLNDTVDGVQHIEIGLSRGKRSLRSIEFFFKSKGIVSQLDPDIVHIHCPAMIKNAIVTCHGLESGGYDKVSRILRSASTSIPLKKKLMLKSFLPLVEYNYRKSRYKHIIAISEMIKEELINILGVAEEDISVVHHGVDQNEFNLNDKAEKRRDVRRSLGIDDDERVLIFVGSYHERKGIPWLIKAFKLASLSDTRLLIVGEDISYESELRSFIESNSLTDKILLLGHRKDVADLYKASDIFVFNALYEPYGLVITEAMSCGLPVIASKYCGALEHFDVHNDYIQIEDPVNVDDISEVLKKSLTDIDTLNQISVNARNKALNLDWLSACTRIENVYIRELDA